MKKILSIFLAFTIMFLLSACADNSSQEDTSSNTTGETQTSNVSADNILIAYFSYPLDDGVDTVSSASRAAYEDGSLGNTNYIASLIQNETGGTLFEIKPEDGFYPTDSFEALAEQTQNEVEDGVRPAIQTSIDNLDDYDVIFVGYPIWWYDMPSIMYTFFEQYDFAGKTIIPFTTHGESQLSGTVETIAELEPDATVSAQAHTVSRNDVTDAAFEVAEWISSLNLSE